MRLLQSSRFRWYLLAVLWLAVILLGVGGFVQQAHDTHTHQTFLDTLYLTMQLATLNYTGVTGGGLNWRLQIARFVVPFMAASTVLQTATVVFAEEFQRLRIRRSSGHAVVAGLGDTGLRMAKALCESGMRVVGLDPDAATVSAAKHAHPTLSVLVGDATEPALLQAVRIDRADRLVVTAGGDARNVAVASAATAIATARRTGPKALRCAVQLHDAELTTLLRAADLESDSNVRLSFFSLHERAARALLFEHPPFGKGAPHRPLVIGLGQFGRSLVVALGQLWAHDHDGERLPITLVDRNASGRWAELTTRHPALDEVYLPELIDLELGEPTPDGIDALVEMLQEDQPSWVAVVVEDEALALANAVFLHQQLPRGEVPIVVRMRSVAGLGTLLDPVSGSDQAFPGVQVFPFLDRTCTVESLDGGIREQLARAVHEDYLAHLPPDAPMTPLHRPWADLTDDQRDDSRRRVDGIVGDLASIGCELVPLRRWGAPAMIFTEAEEDQLAQREHRRWFDDRTAAGWTWGETRDDEAKHNPLLVPWEQLPPEEQAVNVEEVKDLHLLLARAGFEAVRQPGTSPDSSITPGLRLAGPDGSTPSLTPLDPALAERLRESRTSA